MKLCSPTQLSSPKAEAYLRLHGDDCRRLGGQQRVARRPGVPQRRKRSLQKAAPPRESRFLADFGPVAHLRGVAHFSDVTTFVLRLLGDDPLPDFSLRESLRFFFGIVVAKGLIS